MRINNIQLKSVVTTLAFLTLGVLVNVPAYAEDNNAKVTFKGGKLEVSSADGDFSMSLGGQFMLDSVYIHERHNPGDHTFGNTFGDLSQAFVSVQGTLYRNFEYQLQYDFTDDGAAGIRFAYLQYNGWKLNLGKTPVPLAFRVGNDFEQFGLEGLIPQVFPTFMALSGPTQALTPGGRKVGAAIAGLAGPVHFGWGVHGEAPGSETSGADGDSGISTSTRITYDPILDRDARRLLHLGFSARYHDYGDGAAPGNRNSSPLAWQPIGVPGNDLIQPIINARMLGTEPDSITNYGLEFATVAGPFSAQAEYLRAKVSGLNGVATTSPQFDGAYVELSWFLTGESRNYILTPWYSTFARVTPKQSINQGGPGAWQVAARWDRVNLNDGDVRGGEATTATLGINWYLTPRIRAMANYVRVLDVDEGRLGGTELDILATRLQFDF